MDSACGNCMARQDDQWRNCMSNKMGFYVVADDDFKSCMRIPQVFGSYLRKIISDTIKLNGPTGGIYNIGVCREMGEIVLRSGWDVFATANNLEENDYLMFQFCGNSSFKVQIYNSCCGSQKITSFVNPPSEIPGPVPPSTCDHHVPNGNEVPYPGHVQKPTEFDYFTSGGSCLTKAQDEKVSEMVRTIKSDTPLYATVMKKNNVHAKGCFISIPCILLKGFREGLFKATVKLEAPDSNIYSVSAAQHGDDEIDLKYGWDAFVVAHCVQESDLLIFRHKGSSRLEVFILDPNGCLKTFQKEKTSSCFGMKDVSNAQELRDPPHEKTSSVDFIDPPHDPIDVITLSSISDDDTIVPAQTAKSTRPQKQKLGRCAKTRRMASTSTPSIKSEHETDELDDVEATDKPFGPPYIISRKAVLSTAQEKMVLQKVQAIGSEFPIHVSVIHASNIGKKCSYMRFATEYGRNYLPSTSQDLTLRLEGCLSKEWHTMLYVYSGHSRFGFKSISGGWAEFVSDNHLALGDICVFELLTNTRRLRMNVHLIRKPGRGRHV